MPRKRGRRPAHQNTRAFHHQPRSRRTRNIQANSPNMVGLCERCREVINWRIQYRKYKPLKQPRRCCQCRDLTVRQAYHQICHTCAKEQAYLCEKCLEAPMTDEDRLQLRHAEVSKLMREWQEIESEEERRTRFEEIAAAYPDIEMELDDDD